MDNFNFTTTYQVRISDINYGNHVANAAVLNFFHDARLRYLAAIGDFSELDIGGCGLILPEAQVKYLAEMFCGDELLIGVRVTRLGRSSFTLEYRIERDGSATASGSTEMVAFDYTARRPRRLPAPFCAAVQKFEGIEQHQRR